MSDCVLTFPAEALQALVRKLVVEAQRDDQNPSIQRHQGSTGLAGASVEGPGSRTTVNSYNLLSPAAVSARLVIHSLTLWERSFRLVDCHFGRFHELCWIRKEGSDGHYLRAGDVHDVRGYFEELRQHCPLQRQTPQLQSTIQQRK